MPKTGRPDRLRLKFDTDMTEVIEATGEATVEAGPMVSMVVLLTETVTSSFRLTAHNDRARPAAFFFLRADNVERPRGLWAARGRLPSPSGSELASVRGHSPRQAAKTSLGAIRGWEMASLERLRLMLLTGRWAASVGLELREKAPES